MHAHVTSQVKRYSLISRGSQMVRFCLLGDIFYVHNGVGGTISV